MASFSSLVLGIKRHVFTSFRMFPFYSFECFSPILQRLPVFSLLYFTLHVFLFCYTLWILFFPSSLCFFSILNILPSHTTHTWPCSHTLFLLSIIGYFLQNLLIYFVSLWNMCYQMYRYNFSYITSRESVYFGLGLNSLV